jgi:leucine--tRNA ligase
MFPYPSGAGLHVGHPKGYVASDVIARKKMLEGYNVLHPMGFDTFGLGTEQYAIDHKMKPQVVAEQNIKTYISQLEKIGFSYDWERSFSTADPEFYKWTQMIFLKFYNAYFDEKDQRAKPISELEEKLKKEQKSESEISQILDSERLAYLDYRPINRCPHCKTGLANEDLDDGKCERCGSLVEQRPMRQRVLRITKYAQRLLDGLDNLDRDESMKELERNWIGRSEGSQFKMKIQNSEDFFEVFTTRLDTVFGMSFVALAPEHPLVDKITTTEQKTKVQEYKEQTKHKTQLERTELQKEKTGVFTGAYAINPFNGKEIPIYIGDYVLGNY